ncbi:MAG: RimK family alpha-L-glutamate ligase [Candidatus Dojkabacteria bacterium]
MKYLIIDKRQRVEVNGAGEIPTASARLIEELDKKSLASDFAYNDELEFLFLDGQTIIKAKGKDITEYSHIIFRGHALHNDKEYHFKRYIIDYVDQYNEKNPDKKILIQNSEAMKRFPYYNKIAIAMLCSKNNIPHFNTYFRTDGDYSSDREMLKEYPLIIKEYSGVNRIEMIDGKEKIKKNVFKLDKDEDYKQEGLDGQDTTNFFLQEFSDAGEDYRIFVKLGKVIGGFKRTAVDSFKTVSKGLYEMYNEPNEEITAMAEKMAEILDADFMAVDFMYINGKPQIQEIGFHPGYKAYETKIENGTPVNIAEAIITAFK